MSGPWKGNATSAQGQQPRGLLIGTSSEHRDIQAFVSAYDMHEQEEWPVLSTLWSELVPVRRCLRDPGIYRGLQDAKALVLAKHLIDTWMTMLW